MKRSIQERQGQRGFTLVEVIAVLVILGVLAAVAVPKYFDMQKNAGIQAAKATAAEVQARVNQIFAQKLLEGYSVTPTGGTALTGCKAAVNFATTIGNIADSATAGVNKIGDWTIGAWSGTSDGTAAGSDITFTLSNTNAGVADTDSSNTIKAPICN